MTKSFKRQLAILTCTLLAYPLLAQTAPAVRPKILGISHAGYFVSDLPKALDFWHGLLGYDEPYDLKNPDGTTHIAFIKINDHQHIELFNQQPPVGSGHLSATSGSGTWHGAMCSGTWTAQRI